MKRGSRRRRILALLAENSHDTVIMHYNSAKSVKLSKAVVSQDKTQHKDEILVMQSVTKNKNAM